MEEIRKVTVNAPVSIGDVIIKDCAKTGVSIVATRDVKVVL
jgi:CxxC motif-containing protein